MKTNRVTLLLATVLAVLSLTAATQAQRDPGEFARHCIQTINAQAEHGIAGINETCDRTLAGIREALHNGDRELANRIAHHGLARIDRIAHATIEMNNATTRECVARLRRMGADRHLIRAVFEANANAAHHVIAARDHCAEMIRRALHR